MICGGGSRPECEIRIVTLCRNDSKARIYAGSRGCACSDR